MTDKIVFSAATDRINERSQLVVTARLKDRLTGLPAATPTNLRYRLDDLRSGKEITGWTNLTPDDEATITLTSDQNQLHSQCNPEELHQLTVAANQGLPEQYSEVFVFAVQNRTGIR